jgi:pyruvyltransferase
MRAEPEVRVISIRSGIEEFVDQIVGCELVVSSSLHGLIAAEAYGIPAVWIELSDRVLGAGFKFHDYFLGSGRVVEGPIRVGKTTTIGELRRAAMVWRPPFERGAGLLDAAPF